MFFVKPTTTSNASPDDTNNGSVSNNNNATNNDTGNDNDNLSLSYGNVRQKKSTYSADEEEREKKVAEIKQKEMKYQKNLQAQQELLIQMENFREPSDEYGERV